MSFKSGQCQRNPRKIAGLSCVQNFEGKKPSNQPTTWVLDVQSAVVRRASFIALNTAWFGESELFSYADAGAHRFQKRLLVSHVRGRSLNPNSLPEIVIMPDQISLLPSTPHRVKVKKKIKKNLWSSFFYYFGKLSLLLLHVTNINSITGTPKIYK